MIFGWWSVSLHFWAHYNCNYLQKFGPFIISTCVQNELLREDEHIGAGESRCYVFQWCNLWEVAMFHWIKPLSLFMHTTQGKTKQNSWNRRGMWEERFQSREWQELSSEHHPNSGHICVKLSKNKNSFLYTQHMHNHNMYSNHTYITYSLCVHTCMNIREIHLENVTGSLFLLFHLFFFNWLVCFVFRRQICAVTPRLAWNTFQV